MTGKIGYIAVIQVTTDAKYQENKRAEVARQYDQALKSLRKKHPNWSINDCKTILAGKVRIGMSKEQCKEAWGEPDNIHNTTYTFGTNTQWCYGEFCSNALYFENGILTTIQN